MAKNVILSIFAMSKSKDKVINEMRKIATCKSEHINLLSLLALASALNHLQTLENPNISRNFVQIICRPVNFNLSYEQLPDVCHYNEKTIRSHCRYYVNIFLREYEKLKSTPLPLLIARLIEYKLTMFLNINAPSLRNLRLEGIPSLISASRGNEQDRHISIILCEHFYKTNDKIAI